MIYLCFLSLFVMKMGFVRSLAVEDGPRPGNPSAVTSTVVATPSLSSLDEPPADIVVEMNGTVPKEAGSDVSPSVVHTPADTNSTSNQSSRLHPREVSHAPLGT